MFCRKICDGLLKGHMRITPIKQGKQLFADDLI
jgi:hypothetical protein